MRRQGRDGLRHRHLLSLHTNHKHTNLDAQDDSEGAHANALHKAIPLSKKEDLRPVCWVEVTERKGKGEGRENHPQETKFLSISHTQPAYQVAQAQGILVHPCSKLFTGEGMAMCRESEVW